MDSGPVVPLQIVFDDLMCMCVETNPCNHAKLEILVLNTENSCKALQDYRYFSFLNM